MLLVYLLIALTFSTVLTAVFSAHIPEARKGDAFIGFFAAFIALAWAADAWLIPGLAHGMRASWTPVVTLIMFFALLILSLAYSVRAPLSLHQTMPGFEQRFSAEAAVFDLIIWIALVVAGIYVLRRAGM